MVGGEDCLSPIYFEGEFRSRPICGAKAEGNKRQRGSLLFGYFFLAKQEKVSRQSRESDGVET